MCTRQPCIREAWAPCPRSSSSRITSTRLMRYVEFMKKVVPLHDDLFDFFYEALPGYEEVGRRRGAPRLLGFVPESGRLRLQLPER